MELSGLLKIMSDSATQINFNYLPELISNIPSVFFVIYLIIQT
jgi:hypothetical protein